MNIPVKVSEQESEQEQKENMTRENDIVIFSVTIQNEHVH